MFSTHFKKNFCFSIASILLPSNALNLDQCKILSFGKNNLTGEGVRKDSGKWQKCWLPTFSPFLTLFFFPFKNNFSILNIWKIYIFCCLLCGSCYLKDFTKMKTKNIITYISHFLKCCQIISTKGMKNVCMCLCINAAATFKHHNPPKTLQKSEKT